MTAILLTLLLGNWSLVGDDGWQLVEPPPVVEPEPEPPKAELTEGCANGQCGVPRRGVWRRRR